VPCSRVFEVFQLVAQLMCAFMGIDRFITIVYPYQHKKIMSKKFVCGLVASVCVLAVGLHSLITSTMTFQFVPRLAQCTVLTGFPLAYMSWVFLILSSTELVVAINVYLYWRPIKSTEI